MNLPYFNIHLHRNLFFILTILNSIVNGQPLFDTISINPVGPGMIHTKLIESNIPWNINVLEVDLENPFLKIETVKSNDRLAGGRETTTSMANRKNSVGHWSVGAVNGDFFDLATGQPINIQIVDGEILRKENPGYPTIGFNANKNISLSKPAFSGSVFMGDSTLSISGINESRGNNQIILYNSYYGLSTGTSNGGTELIAHPLNEWFANDTLLCIIDSVISSSGNLTIPKGKMILSASGTASSYFNAYAVRDDTFKVLFNVLPSLSTLKEMIGGHPIIVTNGALANIDPNDPLVYNRHPRTGIGFNADTSRLFLITVDGRQTISAGMTLFEFADFMIQSGIYQGMNFDGGGSTTMAVRGNIVNSPSDASGERTVANALLIVSTAPLGATSIINISPDICKVFTGRTFQFTVTGTDQYYNPSTLNPANLQFSLSKPSLGNISPSGLLTAGSQIDTGYVYAHYNSLIDSALVIIKGIDRIEISPKSAVTDNSRIISFNAKVFDTDNVQQQIPLSSLNWVSSDTIIGKIDLAGQFKGISEGTVKVIVFYSGKSDTAIVSVEILYGQSVLDSLENLQTWSLSGENIDSILTTMSLSTEQHTIGEYSFKIDYSFAYQTGEFNWIYLNTDIPVSGIPDSIFIDFLSDGKNHRIFCDVEDALGNIYRILNNKIANKNGIFETIKSRVVSSSGVIFPLKLRRIAIPLGSEQVSGQVYSGTIYIDNISVKYPQNISGIVSDLLQAESFKLFQNYPNPFNPTTTISFSIAQKSLVNLKLYDILGNELGILIDEEKPAGIYNIKFDGKDLSSGVYFYKLNVYAESSRNFSNTKKLILLK